MILGNSFFSLVQCLFNFTIGYKRIEELKNEFLIFFIQFIDVLYAVKGVSVQFRICFSKSIIMLEACLKILLWINKGIKSFIMCLTEFFQTAVNRSPKNILRQSLRQTKRGLVIFFAIIKFPFALFVRKQDKQYIKVVKWFYKCDLSINSR
jgi:hypothetical protein